MDLALATGRGPAVLMESSGVDGFWIHLDVDVLTSAVMPAVDSPQPDGLAYPEPHEILGALLRSRAPIGLDVTIFDPDRDPTGESGRRLTDFLVETLGPLTTT